MRVCVAYSYQGISIDTTMEVVGLMAHPLASILGKTNYIIWEVLGLMVHPLSSIAGIILQKPQFT